MMVVVLLVMLPPRECKADNKVIKIFGSGTDLTAENGLNGMHVISKVCCVHILTIEFVEIAIKYVRSSHGLEGGLGSRLSLLQPRFETVSKQLLK